MPLEFMPLASSSDGCCYRLGGGGARQPLLLDGGIRFDLIRRGLNFQVSQLCGCLLTHAHGDHKRAVKDLMRAGVDVYASVETWDALPERREFPHRAYEVVDGHEYRVGDWLVKPFEVAHDADGTLGFLIGSPAGDRFLYLTDTAYSPFRFEGLTHIAIECNWDPDVMRLNAIRGVVDRERYRRTTTTHMSLPRLLKFLKANDLSKCEEIWLLHLSDANSDEADFKRQVQEATGIPTYIAAKGGPL